MFEIKNKVVIVTGGASGIGACIVHDFLRAGVNHVTVADIDVAAGTALQLKLNTEYGPHKVMFIKCDVRTNELDQVFDLTLSKFGYLDIIVNNAGILNESPQNFVREIEINMTATIRSSLRAYSLMRKDRGGRGGAIVNVASAAALTQFPLFPVYGATKSAVLHFSNCLGMEPHFSRSEVRVVTICFGFTETSLMICKDTKIDKETDDDYMQVIHDYPTQSVESAAKGLIDAIAHGSSASTWLVTVGRPAEDVTHRVKQAFEIMGQGLLH